jgi:hypothetical protein
VLDEQSQAEEALVNPISKVIVMAAALAAVLALVMGASAGTGSFTDPPGDGNGAADITGRL